MARHIEQAGFINGLVLARQVYLLEGPLICSQVLSELPGHTGTYAPEGSLPFLQFTSWAKMGKSDKSHFDRIGTTRTGRTVGCTDGSARL